MDGLTDEERIAAQERLRERAEAERREMEKRLIDAEARIRGLEERVAELGGLTDRMAAIEADSVTAEEVADAIGEAASRIASAGPSRVTGAAGGETVLTVERVGRTARGETGGRKWVRQTFMSGGKWYTLWDPKFGLAAGMRVAGVVTEGKFGPVVRGARRI